MSVAYSNLNEIGRAAENARKAFELRGKVNERERLNIEAFYYWFATGSSRDSCSEHSGFRLFCSRRLAYRSQIFGLSHEISYKQNSSGNRGGRRRFPEHCGARSGSVSRHATGWTIGCTCGREP